MFNTLESPENENSTFFFKARFTWFVNKNVVMSQRVVMPNVEPTPLPNVWKRKVREAVNRGLSTLYSGTNPCGEMILSPCSDWRWRTDRESGAVPAYQPDAGMHLAWRRHQTRERDRAVEERRGGDRPCQRSARERPVQPETSASIFCVEFGHSEPFWRMLLEDTSGDSQSGVETQYDITLGINSYPMIFFSSPWKLKDQIYIYVYIFVLERFNMNNYCRSQSSCQLF